MEIYLNGNTVAEDPLNDSELLWVRKIIRFFERNEDKLVLMVQRHTDWAGVVRILKGFAQTIGYALVFFTLWKALETAGLIG